MGLNCTEIMSKTLIENRKKYVFMLTIAFPKLLTAGPQIFVCYTYVCAKTENYTCKILVDRV